MPIIDELRAQLKKAEDDRQSIGVNLARTSPKFYRNNIDRIQEPFNVQIRSLTQQILNLEVQEAAQAKDIMIQESRKVESFEAMPPGDVPKMTQTNDILKFAAIIAGILVLSS